jgi:hypothetical protein
MEQQQESREPSLKPIFKGWAAQGDGWAVHGRTQEEALEKYRKAEQRRREILDGPPRHKPIEMQSEYEEEYV